MHARIYQFSFIVLTSASKSGCLTPPYDKQQMIFHGHCGNCISEEEVHIYTFLIKINHSMFFSVPTAKRFCGVFFVCLLFLVFSFLVSEKNRMYESTPHLTHKSYNSKREGQVGRRRTMSASSKISQVQLAKLGKKRNDEAEDRRLYQHPCPNSFAETVCHLVVGWPPIDTILKIVKTWRI